MKKLNFFNEIDKAVDSGILVIVEGKKDKIALEKIGFENIFIFHGKPFYKAVENIEKLKPEECIILTDFDRKGRYLYHSLKKELERRGIRIKDRLRRAMLRERISHIEGLATFIQNRLRTQ